MSVQSQTSSISIIFLGKEIFKSRVKWKKGTLRADIYLHDNLFKSLRDRGENLNELMENYRNIIQNQAKIERCKVYQNLKLFNNIDWMLQWLLCTYWVHIS